MVILVGTACDRALVRGRFRVMVDDDAAAGARGCPCHLRGRSGPPRPRTARVDEALALLGSIDPAGPLAP